jgi:outer membrane biosynthesis protein TonB
LKAEVRKLKIIVMSAASSGTHTHTPTALFGTATQGTTRQATYVQRNIVVLSCNNYYREEAIRITYSGYVLVAFGIQYAVRMRHVVICGPFGSTIFFYVIS